MEYPYLEFDEKELTELFKKYDLNKVDIKSILEKISDEYLENKITLGLFLQYINLTSQILPKSVYYPILFNTISKIENYNTKNNIDTDNLIYELKIFCLVNLDAKIEASKVAEELLKKDPNNKKALTRLIANNEYLEYSYNLSKNKLLNNDFEYIGIFYSVVTKKMYNTNEKANNNIKPKLNKFLEKYYRINKNKNDINKLIYEYDEEIKDFEYLISVLKKRNYVEEDIYIYRWSYYSYNNIFISLIAVQLNLANACIDRYRISNDVSYKNKAMTLYKEIIKTGKIYLNEIHKDRPKNILTNFAVENLTNIYIDDKKYDECIELIKNNNNDNPDFYRIAAICTYKKNENEENARQAILYFKKYISEYKENNPHTINVVDIGRTLNSVIIMNEMKKYIKHDMDKNFLYDLYFYYINHNNLKFHILKTAVDIGYYELSYKISEELLNSGSSEYKEILQAYIIYSLHKLNNDTSKNLIDIFNKDDFNNYELIIDLINECAKSKVLEDINIENKNVLIDIYEIMSNTRKELVIMRLFDYVRNADAYANKTFNKDMNEEITNKVAKWKGNDISIKYKNKEYVLCYHFHSSNEIEKDVNGNIVKDNRGKPLRRLPDKNWIAINQIRDSLAHRVNEKTSDVNEEIINAKKAREFINANFEYIIQCLFSVIIENNLLTNEQFRSDEF